MRGPCEGCKAKREKHWAGNRRFCDNCVEAKRVENYKSQYTLRAFGMSRAAYEAKMNAAGKKPCPICKRTVGRAKMHMDHAHGTKKVRGVLCSWCNQSLGWLERHGTKATAYLKGR